MAAILDRIKKALQSPAMKIVAIILAIVILIAVAVKFHLFALLWHSRWLVPIAIVISALVAFAIIYWGIPWFREWLFMRKYGSGREDSGPSPEEFRAKFRDAVRRLRELPQLAHSRDPVQALPWYLMLGGGGSGKTMALQASGLFTPHTQLAAEGGTENCDWWVANTMVVLDTAGRYAFPGESARDRGEWYRLLQLIKHYRVSESLNGIIVTVAASQLASDSGEQLKRDGGVIRERIEEAIRQLGVIFPVYLLVTKSDLIEGFAEFFGAMPQRVLGEALGYVEEQFRAGDAVPKSLEPMQRLQAGLRTIAERLHLLRMALLNSKLPETLREPIFCFLEENRALEQPLRAFAAPLMSEDVVYHTPLFRGIFFSSARREGTPVSIVRRQLGVAGAALVPDSTSRQPYFLRDLFATIVPRDRALCSLARPKRKVA